MATIEELQNISDEDYLAYELSTDNDVSEDTSSQEMEEDTSEEVETESEDPPLDQTNEQNDTPQEIEESVSNEENQEVDSTEESVEESSELKEGDEASEMNEWEAEFKEPFKASGKMIQVDNPKELKKLAQMGVDYHKEMQKISKHKKVIATLENHNINEQDLSLLIDIKKGDKSAIRRIIENNQIDPMELLDIEDTYQPNTSNVMTTSEIDMKEALRAVDESPKKEEITNLILREWDEQSQKAILTEPKKLLAVKAELEGPRFEQVYPIYVKDKMFNSNTGETDYERYSRVAWHFSNPQQGEQPQQQPVVNVMPQQAKQSTINKSAFAPSSTKGKQTSSQQELNDITTLKNMSDEEYMKRFG